MNDGVEDGGHTQNPEPPSHPSTPPQVPHRGKDVKELDPTRVQLGRKLGAGSFATVYLGKLQGSSKKYVVKRLDRMHGPHMSEVENEVEILREAGRHPNLVPFKGWYKDEEGVLCLVLGYCDGGTLASVLKNHRVSGSGGPGGAIQGPNTKEGEDLGYFSEEVVMSWFVQLLMGLHHLHQRHILHRDLKPDNIFLSKNLQVVRLGDLGIAKQLDSTLGLAVTRLGTPYYMSPEIITNQPYTYASDMWALGCVLYEMAVRKSAFEARGLPQLMVKILRNAYTPLPSRFSQPFKMLVSALLKAEPEARPNTGEILQLTLVKKHIQRLLGLTKVPTSIAPKDVAYAVQRVVQKIRAKEKKTGRPETRSSSGAPTDARPLSGAGRPTRTKKRSTAKLVPGQLDYEAVKAKQAELRYQARMLEQRVQRQEVRERRKEAGAEDARQEAPVEPSRGPQDLGDEDMASREISLNIEVDEGPSGEDNANDSSSGSSSAELGDEEGGSVGGVSDWKNVVRSLELKEGEHLIDQDIMGTGFIPADEDLQGLADRAEQSEELPLGPLPEASRFSDVAGTSDHLGGAELGGGEGMQEGGCHKGYLRQQSQLSTISEKSKEEAGASINSSLAGLSPDEALATVPPPPDEDLAEVAGSQEDLTVASRGVGEGQKGPPGPTGVHAGLLQSLADLQAARKRSHARKAQAPAPEPLDQASLAFVHILDKMLHNCMDAVPDHVKVTHPATKQPPLHVSSLSSEAAPGGIALRSPFLTSPTGSQTPGLDPISLQLPGGPRPALVSPNTRSRTSSQDLDTQRRSRLSPLPQGALSPSTSTHQMLSDEDILPGLRASTKPPLSTNVSRRSSSRSLPEIFLPSTVAHIDMRLPRSSPPLMASEERLRHMPRSAISSRSSSPAPGSPAERSPRVSSRSLGDVSYSTHYLSARSPFHQHSQRSGLFTTPVASPSSDAAMSRVTSGLDDRLSLVEARRPLARDPGAEKLPVIRHRNMPRRSASEVVTSPRSRRNVVDDRGSSLLDPWRPKTVRFTEEDGKMTSGGNRKDPSKSMELPRQSH